MACIEDINEQFLIQKYNELMQKEDNGYSLVSIVLKDFLEYRHIVGHEHSEDMIQECFTLLSSCLKEEEYIVHLHSWYFYLLVKCPAEEASLHVRAPEFHFAVRDGMEAKYGKKLYLEIGFYPRIKPGVDFYSAQYYADLCRYAPHHHYPETNYDMYYVSFESQKERFSKLEAKVQEALDTGEFKLYLQPKIETATGHVVGAEALMRWINADGDFIPLSDFLPNLEENGFIRDVDLYLFDKGCRYIEKWRKEHNKDVQISFNLSRAYFNDRFFESEYRGVFEKYDIPGHLVCIELLESIVFNDLERLKMIVQTLYDFGFECALDDFGSGFSSFDILTNVPLHLLKIDQSLFKNIDNYKERFFIKHIVEIAHEFGMKTVAEGVETKEYAQYLSEIDCDFIQGFYYYKPMPIEEFEKKFILEEC